MNIIRKRINHDLVRRFSSTLFAIIATIIMFAPYQQGNALGGELVHNILIWVVYVLLFLIIVSLALTLRRKDLNIGSVLAMLPAIIMFFLNAFHSYGEVKIGGLVLILWVVFCLFPKRMKLHSFIVFKKILVVASIVGIVCYLCYVLNIPIPYNKIHYYFGSSDMHYVSYGISFLYERGGGMLRLCGLCNEPGFFGTICALILCAGGIKLKKKSNIIIFIAGIMTFSVAFWILIIFYLIARFFVTIYKDKNLKRKIIKCVCAVILLISYFLVLPNVRTGNYAIDTTINRLTLTTDGLSGDNRTSAKFDKLFDSMPFTDMSLGLGKGYLSANNIKNNLSYKVYIVEYGLIGCIILWGALLLAALYCSGRNITAIIFVITFFASIYQRPNVITAAYAILLFGGIEYIKNAGKYKYDEIKSGNKKKVMHFIYGLGTGGAETLVKNYLLNFDKDKFDIVLLCLMHKKESPYEKILMDNGIRVIYAEDYLLFKKHSNIITKMFNHYHRYFIARRVIKAELPDILHTHLAINTFVKFARPQEGTIIINTIHTEPNKLWSGSLKRRMDYKAAKWLVKHYNMRFIVLHESMREQINKIFNISNSIILNNGVNVAEYKKINLKNKKELRKSLDIPKNAFIIGHVGRFSAVKNHDFLIDIFEEIREKNKTAFLLMIGDGSEKNRIIDRLDDLDLHKAYKILSNRSDVQDLLGIMDVFVFPSHYEGLPVSLVEAQEAKLPCFISDTINKSVIISNIVSVLSLEQDAKGWAKTIVQYRKPKKIILKDDDWDICKITKKLEHIYLDAIIEKRNGKK